MDNKEKRIAVASSDGIVVNEHFGRSSKFYIYKLEDRNIEFLEVRNVTPICNGGNHDDKDLEKNVKVISDCNYLLVSRIGNGAANVAYQYGIDSYEIPGVIEESIEELYKFIQIKELFI